MRNAEELARMVDRSVAKLDATFGPADDPLERRRDVAERILRWLRLLEPQVGRRA